MKGFFAQAFQDAQRDSALWLNTEEGQRFDKKTSAIIIISTLCLILAKELGRSSDLLTLPEGQLPSLTWWVAVIVVFYLLMPLAIARLAWHDSPGDYGLRFTGAFAGNGRYIFGAFLVMAPLIALLSNTKSFQAAYPFYLPPKPEGLFPFFWIWEALYVILLFAHEFFFRGFLLHGLKRRFGYYSVFVMTIPYAQVHFGKPPAETLAALAAGIFLGTLSLRSRSIFPGLLIHSIAAVGMDLCALWHRGQS